MAPLKINTEETNGKFYLKLSGDLTWQFAPNLKEVAAKAIKEEHCQLVADISDVDYLDSTALGVLVGLLKRCREKDGDLSLICENNPGIWRIFRVTNLNSIFHYEGAQPND